MYSATMPSPDNNLVMLVDDAPDNLKMLSTALDEAGYRVLIATDGASAIERVDYIVPDIVLLDALMPGLDGFETCARLKAHPAAGQVPVVFMTGLTEPEHVVRGFRAGGVDYVTKPLDTEVVVARLQTHLRNARKLSTAFDLIDAAARAVVALDARGAPVWRTGKARLWLAAYFDCAEDAQELPTPLAGWIARNLASGAAAAPLVVDKAHGRLTLSLSAARGETLLLLEESARGEADGLAGAYGLTPREGDVLQWLAKGKTNRDIADILGMSPRTVNKHLEHIFVKLGVETRAAAAALAVRHLHA
ncbi:LuxR family transcriptional regulator [Bordetella pseudohinzii]|uniref:DNA-binding response regulator n=2 Tax=Bordetella pseudohinzii TaxID=1331258 RepID=A0A0J6CBV8_9BORD|nr:DNA-binding response regulator [Bordetella pseudohinzii]KMM27022.1 LuxR family transcriptional regulator [Bordetella pseudohinzii]KXA78267.1 LuxR family transcriptional regulator [Bordetella pseudohinzii]KXA82372.1 LuxR family transcriptional regulator [Bordetella pseudohinzii]CUI55225.1 Stalked cell differentiation-controlling protein [Bordetella pseudohinzii]